MLTQVAAKVSMQELLGKDKGDESLEKMKKTLVSQDAKPFGLPFLLFSCETCSCLTNIIPNLDAKNPSKAVLKAVFLRPQVTKIFASAFV
jgi:hypothetical protein